jgi:hypothetical protein
MKTSGCSAARLAHLVWDQRVAGSNPATPTNEKACHESAGLCFLKTLKACFQEPEKQSPKVSEANARLFRLINSQSGSPQVILLMITKVVF